MPKNEYTCDCTVVHSEAVEDVEAKLLPDDIYESASQFFKVFGDNTRVRIIAALDCRELCVCDIATILGMTKSAVSHQLATLRKARLVSFRRDGKTVYYSLADEHIREILECGLDHVRE